jgi:hypothetical protein
MVGWYKRHIQVPTSAHTPAASAVVLLLCLLCAAGIYEPAFIAANQEARADNIIKGSKMQQVGHSQPCSHRVQEWSSSTACQQLRSCM